MRLTTKDVAWALDMLTGAVDEGMLDLEEDMRPELGDRTLAEFLADLRQLAGLIESGGLAVHLAGGKNLNVGKTLPPRVRAPGPMVCSECGAPKHPDQTTVHHAIGCTRHRASACGHCGVPIGWMHASGCPDRTPENVSVAAKPVRTFDPLVAAVGNVGTREEALQLLGAIAEFFGTLDERTSGFVRGMRDKLVTDDVFEPSEKQMDWLRSLAEDGPHRRRRR